MFPFYNRILMQSFNTGKRLQNTVILEEISERKFWSIIGMKAFDIDIELCCNHSKKSEYSLQCI